MDDMEILRLLPSMPVIAEELDALGWQYQADIGSGGPGLRGVRMFRGQEHLDEGYIYVVRQEDAGFFPAHRAYICCPQHSPEELLEVLLELFQRYQEWERQLDGLVLSNADLEALCRWGMGVLGNPVIIHDSWFIILAMSDNLPQGIQPENLAGSTKNYIPRRYVDSFRDDPDYLRSRTEKKAGLWVSKVRGESNRCIYANLWDGAAYQGRLLVLEESQTFRASHFLAAECLAQRAMLILKRRRAVGSWGYHSLDDIVYGLLTGQTPDVTDMAVLLNTLQWRKTDRYQCIRLQSRQPETANAQMVHSDLFQLFPDSYIMFIRQQQCVVLNLSRTPLPPSRISRSLDDLCRDYRLYAGISSPVWGIEELRHAFRQADIALGTAFHRQDRRWVVPFSACALEYMLRNIQTDLCPGHLAAPELLELLDYDRRRGTAYFSTLRMFLINERDINKASQVLIIHRTTLIYRLKKIQSIISVDLKDPDQRLYLLLSFRLLEQAESLTGQETSENEDAGKS